jgi:glycerol-1-phosphate dehydrogenase [NAD(P)+]
LKLIKAHTINHDLENLLNKTFAGCNIYVLTGKTVSYSYAVKLFEKSEITTIYRAYDSKEFIEQLPTKISSRSNEELLEVENVIIGIGGGVIIDISKEIAFQTKSKLVLIPTVFSNDGLASGLVVLNSVNGGRSIFRKVADYILIDYLIINNSPVEYVISAVGEIFSKYSSIVDFNFNIQSDKNKAKQKILESLKLFDKDNYFNVVWLLKSLVLSGEAINIAKKSSPASGSEHLLYHAFVDNGYLININHGTAVASLSIFTLSIQEELLYKHLKIMTRLGIPLLFPEIKSLDDEKLYHIFEYAKNYKLERKTILDKYTTSELVEKFRDFMQKLELRC